MLLSVHRQKPWGLLGTGSAGRPPRLSHSSGALREREREREREFQCCFSSTETIRIIRDGEPRTSTSTFTQLLNSPPTMVQVQCCFTPTETVRAIMDGEPRTSTSTFTQLLSSNLGCSSSVLLYVHRDHKDCQGRGAQDVHLDFHTAPELWFRRPSQLFYWFFSWKTESKHTIIKNKLKKLDNINHPHFCCWVNLKKKNQATNRYNTLTIVTRMEVGGKVCGGL